MMEHTAASAVLEIDLGAIAENYRRLKAQAGENCAVCGIVKADAYGLGAERIVPVLERLDCPLYFVATPLEGAAVRALTRKPVAILGGVFAEALDLYRDHSLVPVLNSPRDLEIWTKEASRESAKLPAFLHLDTGMNRLGFTSLEWQKLIDDPAPLAALDLGGIISHFACADEADHPLTPLQAERFHAGYEALSKAFGDRPPRCLANSAGLFRDPAYALDMARPGMALYGLNPMPEGPNPMRPVVSLRARVLQIREARAGESIGYGASHSFGHDTRIATLAIGYADGFLRSGSGRGKVFWQGRPCQVRGRISMDLTGVDLGDIKGPLPAPGDWLEIVGPHRDADAVAADAGTVGYEVLTSLGGRYARHYRDIPE